MSVLLFLFVTLQPWGIYLYAANAFYLVRAHVPSFFSPSEVVAIILMAVAGVARSESVVTTVSVVGGIIAAGVFLFIIAALGIIAVYKQKRGLIFIVGVVDMHHH
jgi:hypothetical protein